MTREDLDTLLSGSFDKVTETFTKLERKIKIKEKLYTIEDIRKQYDPHSHEVTDLSKRPDKIVDIAGDEYVDALTGETKTQIESKVVTINRLPFPIQKKITLISAAFMVGEKINLESNPKDEIEKTLLELLKKVWGDNKLDYKSKELAKLRMSETHCAELWYDYTDAEYWEGTINKGSTRRLGCYILSESNGDKLYPIFDQFKDLIAFGRGYSVMQGDKEVQHLDIITADNFYNGVKDGGEWEVDTKKNPYGAINVIYYEQPVPEWGDVQPLINRKETFASNFSDSNDYFAFPAVVANGDVENLPSKDEVGKLFQVEVGGSVSFLSKDSAPESMKMELDLLDKEIHSGTHTPDISFETMKQLLGNVSGVALKMLFMDAQLKASDNQEKFGECIQRRINLLKRIIISFNPGKLSKASGLSISPKFRPFMPVNDVEYNTLLMSAYEKGMISQRTMLEYSTLVKNADEELEQIKKEAKDNPKPVEEIKKIN